MKYVLNQKQKVSDTIFNYVVVQYADEWYEEHKGIVFHTYKDTKDYLIKNKLTTLLNKLDYLESIKHQMFVYDDNKVDLVVSYY